MFEVAPISDHRTGHSAARVLVAIAVTVGAIGLGGYAVWDQIPSLSSVLGALSAADPFWLLAALIAEIIAVMTFAMIQRRLVIDLGGTLSLHRSVDLTLASGAISSALPAGTALGAGYTYRRLRRAGLGGADVGVTMVASAGLLTGALLLLYGVLAGPALLAELTDVIGRNQVGTLVVLIAAMFLYAILTVPRPAREKRPTQRRWTGWIAQYSKPFRVALESVTLAAWRAGATLAVIKWAADFAVLVCATIAVGANVDLVTLATVYVGVQVLRQIPITPGGVGLIEAALLAGLVAAGAVAAPAAAAVVIYRAFTFWLVLPAGAVAAFLDRAPVVLDAAGLPVGSAVRG